MSSQSSRRWLIRAASALAVGCASWLAMAEPTVIDGRALADESDGRNWAGYGRTFSEKHYSPLTEINAATIGRLGLAWSLDLEPQHVLSTPLAVDGVIYLAVGYSVVHAVDARTGKLLWRYDPGVRSAPASSCVRAGEYAGSRSGRDVSSSARTTGG